MLRTSNFTDVIIISYHGTSRHSCARSSVVGRGGGDGECGRWLGVGHCGPLLARCLSGQACMACSGAGWPEAELRCWDGGAPFTMCFILIVSCALRAKSAICDFLVINAFIHSRGP